MSDPKWLTDFDKEVAVAQEKEEAAIRADERAKCRAELWEQISELLNHDPWMDAYERWNAICRWAQEEAFKGE